MTGTNHSEQRVVYHLQNVSGNFGWKVNGTQPFLSFEWNISGNDGTSKKVVLFSRTECSKRKFMFDFIKPHLWYQFEILSVIKMGGICANGKSQYRKEERNMEF